MFALWRTSTAMQAIEAKTITGHGSPSANATNGSAKPVTIEASEA